MDFLREQTDVWPWMNNRKISFRPGWSYWQYSHAVPPCESDFWPAEGAVSPQMVPFLCWSLLLKLRHAIQEQKEGWTFTFIITGRDIFSATDQPHQHKSILHSRQWKPDSCHHTSKENTPWTDNLTSHQCISLCWASWKHFLIK